MSPLLSSVSFLILASQGAGQDTAQSAGQTLAQEIVEVPTASPVPTQRPIDINLPLTLDDRYLGDIRVLIDGDIITFDGERFIALVERQLTPSVVATLRARLENGRLSAGAATTADVRTIYNTATQQIEAISLLSARGRQLLNFGSQIESGTIVNAEPAGFALFVNTTAAIEYRWQGRVGDDKGLQPLSGTFDIGGRVGRDKGIAFFSRQSWRESGGPAVTRDETQLIYDNSDHLLRVTAGDLRYRADSFQSASQIAGVTVERFFGLQPQRLFRPIGRTEFELERSSTVEVRLNGVVLQQLLLSPGRYDLRDFPLAQGSNNVELLIRDDTGRETLIGGRSYFDFNLLEPGITDFSFSGGVRSGFKANGGLDYSDDPAISGFVRHGFSDTVTAGANIQSDVDGGMAGATVLWASPIGVLRAEASGSQRSGFGSGYAASVGYFNSGYLGGRKWRWQVNGNAEQRSSNFTTLADVFARPENGSRQLIATSFDLSATVSSPKINFSLSANYNIQREGRPNSYSAVLGATYTVNNRLSATVLGRYSETALQREQGVFLQLLWRFGRSKTLRGSYDTSRREANVQFQQSSSRDVGGLTYDVGVRRNADADTFNATGNAFYTANRGEIGVQHNLFDTANLDGPRIQATRVVLGTSVVFAGGKVAISRPVQDGFAIIERHKSLEGRRLIINPTDQGARATSDALGPAVVPDLQSYDTSSLYLDVEDLPPGYSLGTGQFTLKAPLYSGYRLEAGSSASFTVLADTVYDDNSAPVMLIGGELQSLDRPGDPPVSGFTNRSGRFAASGLRPGKYRLTLFTDPIFVTEIEILDGDTTLIILEQIRVTGQ